jgi:hypothetical protein
MDVKELESFLLTLALIKIDLCNRGLPIEITLEIVNPVVKLVRKLTCQKKEMCQMFMGTSKSAMKRRSKCHDVCLGCGRDNHNGECKWSTTSAQDSKKRLVRDGTIRVLLETERSLPQNRYKETEQKRLIRYAKALYCINMKRLEKNVTETLGNLSIKDPHPEQGI